jgi:hypothetical protein
MPSNTNRCSQKSTLAKERAKWVQREQRSSVLVDVSPSANRYIRARGGRVFVWFKDLNDAWMIQKVSTSRPGGGPLFDEHHLGDFRLFLQSDFNTPDSIRVRLRPWWLFQPLSVSGTGAGVDFGGGGGGGEGGGWKWPDAGGGGGGDGGGHGGGH